MCGVAVLLGLLRCSLVEPVASVWRVEKQIIKKGESETSIKLLENEETEA